jgi:Helix-turn-helix domain
MKGEINTSFYTGQSDLFDSGIAASVGMNSIGVWLAIKTMADNRSGIAYPSVRRLAEVTGLATSTVQNCLKVLQQANFLRMVSSGSGGKSARWIARERLEVKIGNHPVCVIAIDYVPSKMRKRLADLSHALENDIVDEETFAACDIIPAEGFAWDPVKKILRKEFPVKDLPDSDEAEEVQWLKNDLSRKVLAVAEQAKKRKREE